MQNGKKVVVTYGTYDLFHYGHEALLRRAKELGDYLIVGVTSDGFDRVRGKLNVHQSLTERLRAVEATGIPDLVVVEEYQGQKISDIRKYGVDVFAIGSDWEGKFDYLKRYCDVVYLPRTEGVSSTALRAEAVSDVTMGIIGADYLAARFVRESTHVAGVDVKAVLALRGQDASAFAADTTMNLCQRFDEMSEKSLYRAASVGDLLEKVDAVYISAAIDRRAQFIRAALEAGCHVICEGPLFLSQEEGKHLFELAESKGKVLMEANKTLYFPAFEHLRWLLESGVVGEIKDISASYSHVFSALDKTNPYEGSFYDMASYILLPAMVFLGSDYRDARMICSYEGDFCTWAKTELLYDAASATCKVGRGMKTEGDMIITGTDGYVYIPAPWWKTDYFELRNEDPHSTKKYYFECAGEGQRYEIFEFLRLVRAGQDGYMPMHSQDEVLAVTRLVERFDQGDVIRLNSGAYHFGGGETVTDR